MTPGEDGRIPIGEHRWLGQLAHAARVHQTDPIHHRYVVGAFGRTIAARSGASGATWREAAGSLRSASLGSPTDDTTARHRHPAGHVLCRWPGSVNAGRRAIALVRSRSLRCARPHSPDAVAGRARCARRRRAPCRSGRRCSAPMTTQPSWLDLGRSVELCRFTDEDGNQHLRGHAHARIARTHARVGGLPVQGPDARVRPQQGQPRDGVLHQPGRLRRPTARAPSGGGWVDTADTDVPVVAMCVFPDGSMIDEWGLAYHSDGTIRGTDLAQQFVYQPTDGLPPIFRSDWPRQRPSSHSGCARKQHPPGYRAARTRVRLGAPCSQRHHASRHPAPSHRTQPKCPPGQISLRRPPSAPWYSEQPSSEHHVR